VTEDLLVKRKGVLIEAEVDGELVALHVENGTCYGFNGTATRIWQMVEEPKRLSELRDALMAEFEVDAETCEQDLRALLRELESDGLVDVAAA
jgi:hypothetical protein